MSTPRYSGHTVYALRLVVAIVLLGGLLPLQGIRSASATTGPSVPQPARYHVAANLARPYRGQYNMTMVARAARLRQGSMAIEINELGYLEGVAQFYGYDTHGYQTSWVAHLYDFQLVRHGVMIIALYAPTGAPLLGRLFVTRRPTGDLTGQIELDRQRYTIDWHKAVTF